MSEEMQMEPQAPVDEPTTETGSDQPMQEDLPEEESNEGSALAFLLALTPLLTLSFFGQIGLI